MEPDKAVYSPTLERALCLAAAAHRKQNRKSTGMPYISHPVHVAIILIKYGLPENAVVAGILHDVVEDTDVTLADVKRQFGDEVANLVDEVSEKKYEGEIKLPWLVRKQDLLSRLAHATPLALAVKSADALHNCQTILDEVREHGDLAWQHFHGSPKDQLWFFRTLADVLLVGMNGHPLSEELSDAVAQLARLVPCGVCGKPGHD